MIVEDGTIVSNADSYVTLEFANAFFTNRGISDWTGDNAVKEAALINATDYIEQEYTMNWMGETASENQSLSWPRFGLKNAYNDEIPLRLKQAVCKLALEALTEDLNPPLDRDIKREKVDVIEVEYMDKAKSGKQRPAIKGLLQPYISGSIINCPAVRV